jgi:hypothetical protein
MKLDEQALGDCTTSFAFAARWGISTSTANRWFGHADFPLTMAGLPHRALSENWVRANKPAIAKRADAEG